MTIRGTVTELMPKKRRFLGLITDLPKITVEFDKKPWYTFTNKLHDLGLPEPQKKISITWGQDGEAPAIGARVWVTFAVAGQLEEFFQGAPPIALYGVEIIKNEHGTKPDEIADPEVMLPGLEAVAA